MNDRSCHSEAEQKTMFKAINVLFTEPINFAKNPIFRFEMVAVVLCWNSVAVDSYLIYSVLEADICKLSLIVVIRIMMLRNKS